MFVALGYRITSANAVVLRLSQLRCVAIADVLVGLPRHAVRAVVGSKIVSFPS